MIQNYPNLSQFFMITGIFWWGWFVIRVVEIIHEFKQTKIKEKKDVSKNCNENF